MSKKLPQDLAEKLNKALADWNKGQDEALETIFNLGHHYILERAKAHLFSNSDQTIEPEDLCSAAYMKVRVYAVEKRSLKSFNDFLNVLQSFMKNERADIWKTRNRLKRGGEVQKLSIDNENTPIYGI